MNPHLNVVTPVDGKKRENILDAAEHDLEKISILSQDMSTVKTHFFEHMETNGALHEMEK
jgi:hypothetical protein